ncbi:solute carrier family 2, facilitated glucose transporter member 3-like [Platysternon megacephalum]|uniref:Solute carrier family 2, facilitated glucose transporter member 3-like n=1 Tax=Platysternon megacephalum TaxID=55544 RepID=A0A4D9DYL6_9SAUR|nr:solute carrier family 2, facilitated glucose transporter member 3-like [Platysternon megacephalum]
MLRTFPVVLLETMSHYTDEPRFTIEQIDLLQRLRRTGMTRHEILHALETLDRLDQEHSDKFGRRSSYGGGSYGNSTNNVPASSSTATASTQTQHSGMSPSPSNSYDTSPQPCTTNQNGRESNERLSAFNGKMSPTRYPLANSLAQRSYSFEASEEDLDVDDKVEELMRRDSSVIKEEIKAFLANRRISQAVVAQVTGISQSRISHWLLQQGSDLSEQKKRAFYRWYQLEKTNPAEIQAPDAPVWFSLCRISCACVEVVAYIHPQFSKRLSSVCQLQDAALTDIALWKREMGELTHQGYQYPKPKKAFYTHYFNENQYPDEAKREEIANACNAVIQKPGKKLSDLERVTSLKVYNWFANRRKEIKRRANIAAILESHGIDVQSPGGHSNSDDVDGNDYSEQDTWQVRNGEEEGRCSEGGREAEKVEEDRRICSKQDDSTSHSDHQDPISLAVEMAAVNHTILALARQGTNEIKTEALDDD